MSLKWKHRLFVVVAKGQLLQRPPQMEKKLIPFKLNFIFFHFNYGLGAMELNENTSDAS